MSAAAALPGVVGYVYIVAGRDQVKIGRTLNPKKRLANLRTAAGLDGGETWVSKPHADYKRSEVRLHNEFRAHRASGEWFRVGFRLAVRTAEGLGLGRQTHEPPLPAECGWDELKRAPVRAGIPKVVRTTLDEAFVAAAMAQAWGPLRYSMEGAATALAISRSQVLRLIKAEEVRSYRDGGRVFISATALRDYIAKAEARAAEQGRPA